MAQEPMMWALTQGSQFQVAPGDTTMESAESKGTWGSWPYGKLCIQEKDQKNLPWGCGGCAYALGDFSLEIMLTATRELWQAGLQRCLLYGWDLCRTASG